jgi:3',5'-cyclic AMP phosphodiesterase CpdA
VAGTLETVIFRFSNQDGNVIDMHQRILADSPDAYVWWGWWKKQHEARRDRALRDLQALVRRSGRVEIALLNRKDNQYFKAELDALEFLTDGERSHSPDEHCPEFYRDRDPGCPAWLRLRRIDSITEAEFRERFDDVPTGDPTLYEVRRLPAGPRIVVPHPTWDMHPIPSSGDTLLHLSDIHFGLSHGFQQRTSRRGDSVTKTRLVERVLETVNLSARDVGVVVLSGDLISKGNTDDFALVEDFLSELLKGLGLGKTHLVIVPGNHDFKTLEALDEAPTMDYAHERPFRNFLSAFLGWRGPELERLHQFELSNKERVVFGALNSARLRGRESKEYGYVGRHRYAEMFDYMQQSLERQKVTARKFAVLHHHVLPVQELEVPRNGVPISITVDAAELFGELQQRGFDAILHGHQHRPFYFRGGRSVFLSPTDFISPRRSVMVIGNGTTGAGGDALVPDFPFNTVGLHRINKDTIELSWFYYGVSVRPQHLSSWEVPWETAC